MRVFVISGITLSKCKYCVDSLLTQIHYQKQLTFERDPFVAPWSMGDRKSLQTKKYVTCRILARKEKRNC